MGLIESVLNDTGTAEADSVEYCEEHLIMRDVITEEECKVLASLENAFNLAGVKPITIGTGFLWVDPESDDAEFWAWICNEFQVFPEDVEEVDRESGLWQIESEEWMILTDDQADKAAADYIKGSLWAFNADFLASHAHHGVGEEVFKAIQSNGQSEDNNEAIKQLISDLDNFIEEAIDTDGRGHFITSYDGQEREFENEFNGYDMFG
jgi:hypothetical protein